MNVHQEHNTAGPRQTNSLRILCILMAFIVVSGANRARAERFVRRAPPSAEQEEDPPPPATPPELQRFVEAEYPQDAMDDGLEAEVLIRIEIDEQGAVTNVEVTEPAGHGFDEAAVAAVRQFEFSPARAGDQPMASRILYRYRFELGEEQIEEPLDDRVTVPGRVTDLDDAPIPGAQLLITRYESEDRLGEPISAQSDEEGHFTVGPIEPGNYEVVVEAAGFVSYQTTDPTPLDGSQELTIRLEREDSQYETVVRARRPGEQLTTRTIDRREVTRVPGASGDALRVIQNMPGMGRPPAGLGMLIVRGSPPGDTNILLETVGVPLLYHFGGLTSIVNSRFIDSIDFMPGNYPVRYGGAHGGIVEVRFRELQQEPFVGWHGEASADLIDAELALEGPIVDGLSFAVAVRRSYVDLIAGAFADLFEDFHLTTAPRYWDWQAVLQYAPNSRHFVRAIGYGSDDSLQLVTRTPPDQGEVIMGEIGTETSFHGVMLQYRYRPDFPLTFNINTSATWFTTRTNVADIFSAVIDNFDFDLRPEVTLRAGEWGRFLFGAHLPINDFDALVTLPDPSAEGCRLTPITRPWEGETSFGPRFYIEAQLRPVEQLRITTGLQIDLYDYSDLFIVEPRLWMRYEVRDGTAIEGGVGVFHQAPSFLESDRFFGNPQLGLEQSIHYGLGIEQRIWGPLTLSVNGFYKALDRLAVNTDRVIEVNGQPTPVRYDATGEGRVYGLEVLLRHSPTRRLFGWISYTLMRSEMRDHSDEDWYLSSFDQTHILTLVAGVTLPRGWEIGIRFRLTSGRPFTPIAGGIYEAECDSYQSVPGERRSERYPLFHQLDLRIDKTWTIRNVVRIWLYLDLQNVYYHHNTEAYFDSFDYNQRYPITGLPILPNLGLGVEF